MSSIVTFHFKSKHLTSLTPVIYGSPPELGGGDPNNGVEMVQIEDCGENNSSSYNFIAEILFSNQSSHSKDNSSSNTASSNNSRKEEWYSYAFKPQFGQIFPEAASYRHFPASFYVNDQDQTQIKSNRYINNINHIKLYDTEGLINAASDCLLVRFKVNKHVEFGTEIFISGNCNELGNWKLNGSKPLSHVQDGSSEYWFVDIKFPILNFYQEEENQGNENEEEENNENRLKPPIDQKLKNSLLARRRLIEYKYFLSSSVDDIRWEPEDNHKILLSFDSSSSSPTYIEVCDAFRYTDNVINVFSRSAFVNVINKRGSSTNSNTAKKRSKSRKNSYFLNSYLELQLFRESVVKPGHVLLSFTVNCPYVQKRQNLIIVGGIPELGNWNPVRGLKMSDLHFPYWTASIVVNRQNSRFSYKYVIEDSKYNNGNDINYDANRFIWENSENRNCFGITNNGIDVDFPSTIAINDWYVSPRINKLFRGVAINVPLFSLKSNNSCGIGEFSDIKLAVDICRSTGCSMIQLMPINDTMRVPTSSVVDSQYEQNIADSSTNGVHNSSSFGHYNGVNRGPLGPIGLGKASSKNNMMVMNPQINRFPSSNSAMSLSDNQDHESEADRIEAEIWAGSNPYNIVSVFALNPIYINIQDVLNEEFEIASKSETFDQKNASNENFFTANNSFYKIYQDSHKDKAVAIFSEIQNDIITNRCRFERDGKIDYPSVLRFKLRLLRKIFNKIVQKREDKYDLSRDKDFIDFTNENEEWLKEYSVFCFLRDKYDTSDFTRWNTPIYHHSNRLSQFERSDEGFVNSKEDINDLYEKYRDEDDIIFTLWLQYICDRQMKSAKEYASTYSIALKVEMPYCVPFNSSDCWAFRRMFDFDEILGSPPDMRCIEGQNYNVPVMRNWTMNGNQKQTDGLTTSSQIALTVSSDPSSTPSSQSTSASTAMRTQYMKYGNHYPSMQKDKTIPSPSNNLKLKKESSSSDFDENDKKSILPVAAKWWKLRMKRMSTLFDAVEIDNTLNFFRNWVIPNGSYRAVNGYFSPSKPFSESELSALYGIITQSITKSTNHQEGPITLNMKGITIERLVKPYVRFHLLRAKFGDEAQRIANEYFTPLHIDQRDDYYDFQERCNTEEKINNILKATIFDEGKRDHYQTALFQLLSNVILIKETPQNTTKEGDEDMNKDEITIHEDEVSSNKQQQPSSPPSSPIQEKAKKYHIRAELTVERVESLNTGGNRGTNFAFTGAPTASSPTSSVNTKQGPQNRNSNGNTFFNKKNNNVMGCTPRTTFSSHSSRIFPSSSWLELNPEMRQKLLLICNDYFFGSRNTEAWLNEARPKLNILNESSSLLIFSNDFNEISATFERELENQQIIKYNVPRYPRSHPNIYQIEREIKEKQKLTPFCSKSFIDNMNASSNKDGYQQQQQHSVSSVLSDPNHKVVNSKLGNNSLAMNNHVLLTSKDIDYLSQCVPTPATEDCLRSWWETNRSATIEFWQSEMVSTEQKPKNSSQQQKNKDQEKQGNTNNTNNNNNNNNNNNQSSNPQQQQQQQNNFVKPIQCESYNYLDDDNYYNLTQEEKDRQPFISDDLASQPPPETCEPWVQELIVSKYLACRSMWCTFMLQDLASVIGKFRKQYPNDECVHRPEQGLKWQYRFPYKLEEILNDGEFTGKLHYLIDKYRGV